MGIAVEPELRSVGFAAAATVGVGIRLLVIGAVALAASCASQLALAQSTGSDNGLGATIMLTKKPEEFVRQWTTSKESDKTTLEVARKVRPGEYIAALVFVRGCRANVDSCAVYVDYELVAPDGSIRYRVPDKSGTSQPGPKSDLYFLSHAIVRFQFKPEDAAGTYTIRAVVREPARGRVVRIAEQFQVVR